jgi:hypothetical protein
MKRQWLDAWAIAAFCVMLAAAQAQTSGAAAAPEVRHGGNGISYISGGAGEEERAAMAAQAQALPFKVVLSGPGGEYIAAETFTVTSAQGGEVLRVRDAGPIVMIGLPAGTYTLDASWKGKSERRSVKIGSGAQTVNWRFPG